MWLREASVDVELGDLLSLLVRQIHHVSVLYKWVLEVFWVFKGGISIAEAREHLALLLRIQIGPLLALASCSHSLATSTSASSGTSSTSWHSTSGWHSSTLSWHSSCNWLASAHAWEDGWVQTLSLSLHPDFLGNGKSLRLGKLALRAIGRLSPDHSSHLEKSRGWSLLGLWSYSGEVLLSNTLLDLCGLLWLASWDGSLGFLADHIQIWVIMLGFLNVGILIFFKRLYSFF